MSKVPSKAEITKFKNFYLSFELNDPGKTAEDILFEYEQAYPENCTTINRKNILPIIAQQEWAVERGRKIEEFSGRSLKEILSKASNLSNSGDGFQNKTALELAIIEELTLKIYTSINIEKLTDDNKMKMLKMILDHSDKLNKSLLDSIVKSNEANVSNPLIEVTGARSHRGPTEPQPDQFVSKDLDGITSNSDELQVVAATILGLPVTKTPPPTKEDLEYCVNDANTPSKKARDDA